MNTKHLIILSFLMLSYSFTQAQKKIGSKQIGVSFSSFGMNEPVYFADLDGTGGYSSKSFYTFGINYIHPLNNWLDIETGIEYSKHTITVTPSTPPEWDNPYNASFSLLNIPITVRVNFWSYFFVNGGVLMDIETNSFSPIDSQTGIGALLGIGALYEFDNGIGLFINPYSKAHSLLPFSSGKYHQRLIESGVRIGLTYVLRN